MNDHADLVGVEAPDNGKAVGDALTVSPAFDFAGRLDHFSAEYDASRPGLRNRVTAAVVGKVTCCQTIADDDKGTVLGDTDGLVAVRSAGFQKIGVMGCCYGIHRFKPIAVDHCFYLLEVGDGLLGLSRIGSTQGD